VTFLYSRASEVRILDLSRVVFLEFIFQLSHSSFDCQIFKPIGLFEVIKFLKFGVVFLLGVLGNIQSE
jgi:hypothetical protein